MGGMKGSPPDAPDLFKKAAENLNLGPRGEALLKDWFSPYRILPPDCFKPDTQGSPDTEGEKLQILARLLAQYGRGLETKPVVNLGTPERVFAACEDFRGGPRELLRVFHLNGRQDLLRVALGALGGPSRLHCTPADILSPVLALGVPKIILAHNHPSGDATPSEEDLLFTRRLEEACHLLGVSLVDHLVVCEGAFTSFRREGLL